MFKNKVIFISGGTGSRGQELTKQILAYQPKEIRIFSRGEHKQVEMKRKFNDHKNVKFFIGDVRDLERIKGVVKGSNIVFHLAALKHVPICEENPYESVLTNIIGTQNIISASLEYSIEKVIDVSTDKACDPFNLYGTCKAVGEKLIIAANNISSTTSFVCVRGGNVLGTNGSVVPLFKEQILRTNICTITDPTMTRYIMRLTEAVGMLLHASMVSVGGEIFVMKMPSITVDMIADAMIGLFGNNKTKKRIIGSRPGEKNHELLVSQYEALNTYQYDNNYYTILPSVPTGRNYDKYKKLPKIQEAYFSSQNTKQLTIDEFQTMIKNDGWIDTIMPSEDELQKLSKNELLNYFKNQGWSKK